MARVTKSLPEINCAKGAVFRLSQGALMPLKALRTLVDPVGLDGLAALVALASFFALSALSCSSNHSPLS